jgi:hypothetical protein
MNPTATTTFDALEAIAESLYGALKDQRHTKLSMGNELVREGDDRFRNPPRLTLYAAGSRSRIEVDITVWHDRLRVTHFNMKHPGSDYAEASFLLADPECFEKLAAFLAEYGIAPDLEGLS